MGEVEKTKVDPVEEEISDSLPCPEGDIFDLPTVAEITNAFNEIAELPNKLTSKLGEMKAEKELEIAELEKQLSNPDLTEEEREAILKQIKEKKDYIDNVILGEFKEEIDKIIEDIEKYIEDLSDILSPFWDKEPPNRDWQKEARDAFTELLQEFHTYIPTKIAELISKLVPINFTVNILGLDINILKLVTSPAYQKELKDQIAGKNYVTQIISKQERLKEVNKEMEEFVDNHTSTGAVDPVTGRYVVTLDNGKKLKALRDEKEQLEKEIAELYDKRSKWVDKFFQLIPEEFRQFDGEFGVLDDEAKAKLTWKYIKTKIKEYIQNWFTAAFQKLIGIFDKIWDLLGLPDLPFQELLDIMNLDIGALIRERIQSIKDKWEDTKLSKGIKIRKLKKEIEELEEKLADPDISMADHIKLSEELKLKIEEKEKLEDELLEEAEKFHADVKEALEGLNIFGYDIIKIIGGKIESATASLEEEIAEISLAFEDFKMNWHKKIMFDWVTIVKKFLTAIGLGPLFDFLLLTWCDFLKLIGMPTNIGLNIAGVAGLVAITKKETKNSPRKVKEEGNVDGIAYTKVENESQIDQTTFTVSTGTGTLHAFVDGVEIEHGDGVTISGGTATFDTAPLTQSEYDLGISKDVSLIRI